MLNTVLKKCRPAFFSENLYKLESRRKQKHRQDEFIHMITLTKEELRHARTNFNSVTDPTLLDYYIYEIKAAEVKLDYYLRLAKTQCRDNADFASRIIFDREGERSLGL